jgi:hypothetical protein
MKLNFKHLVEAVITQQPELVFGGVQKQNNQLNLVDTLKTQPKTSAPASETQATPEPAQQSTQATFNPNRPFPLPWQPGGSADSAEGEYVPTPDGKKPDDVTPVTPPSKPKTQPQPESKPQPTAQPAAQPEAQPAMTPSERYRQSQQKYETATRAHGEFVNAMNKGAWTIGENTIKMQFKKGDLKALLNDAFDPKNPFPKLPWDSKPSPKPITPTGPYSPTPGVVKPKKPTIVIPKSGKIPGGAMGGAGEEKGKNEKPNWGYLAVIPPAKLFAAASGRIGDLGWDAKSEKQYRQHYRNLLGAAGGVAAGIAALPGIRNVLGGAAGLAASMTPKIPKSVSAVAAGAAPLLSSYPQALADEGEELFLKAFLDPRAGSRV